MWQVHCNVNLLVGGSNIQTSNINDHQNIDTERESMAAKCHLSWKPSVDINASKLVVT
jgi:hypothetical protein